MEENWSFCFSANKGGLGGKGWCFWAPDPITDWVFFSWQFIWKLGEANLQLFRSGVFFSPGLNSSKLVLLSCLWHCCETVAGFISGRNSENEGIPGNPAGICRKVQKRRSGCLRKIFEATQTFFSPCCVWRQNLTQKTCWFSREHHNWSRESEVISVLCHWICASKCLPWKGDPLLDFTRCFASALPGFRGQGQ